MMLLPPRERWNVTFNTYFTSLPAGATCAWRCMLADSDELRELRRHPRMEILDLTRPLPEPDGADSLVRRARSGEAPPSEPTATAGPEAPAGNGFRLLAPRRINQVSLRPRGR